MRRSRPFSKTSLITALLAVLFCLTWSAGAGAQIKQPGAHPRYTLELDPHLIVQHARGPFYGDEGLGLGLRASIPLLHNGPIEQINNNIGITFGGDLAFYDDDHCHNHGNDFLGDDCGGTNLWLPVTFQWNFFFTKVVSAFFEPGLAVSYWQYDWEGLCGGDPCDQHASDLDLAEFVVFFGGRFLFSERAGMTVRIGWPYISVGGTFLL